MKVLAVFGTRPEAIKMAPLIKRLGLEPSIVTRVCITSQHREMLDQVLSVFDIKTEYDLNIMKESQGLTDISCSVLKGLEPILEQFKPNYVIVHGDTSTTFAASLAAYYQQIPVAHVEAGLRTQNLYKPWPEEANRKLTGAITRLHFAPTKEAKQNLINEGHKIENIEITGNTVIDALFSVCAKIDADKNLQRSLANEFKFLTKDSKIVLITGHRRESFGKGFEHICQALISAAGLFPSVKFVYPVHLNPSVSQPVYKMLSGVPNIHLIEPLDYMPFVYLMKRSSLILTDSGGIQEEAPSIGKPVLVMRDVTERPEALKSGVVKLVGTNPDKILSELSEILDSNNLTHEVKTFQNPYGDGEASKRIVNRLLQECS